VPADEPSRRVVPLHRAPVDGWQRHAPLLWEVALCALLVVDHTRHYVRINDMCAELLGAGAASILASRIDDFTPPDRHEVLESLWQELLRRGTLHGAYETLRGDGTRSLIEFRATRNYAPGEHLIAAREIAAAVGSPSARPASCQLTAREREVLQLAADGGSAHDVAAILLMSPGTVRTHFEHVYRKLGVRDRAAAVAEGIRRGLID
jgi:DNA-binding CsgD family transcriptional regulator